MDDVPQQENDRLHAMLDIGEQNRAKRFRHPHRRLEFIAAHALVRGLLSLRTGLPPRLWRLTAESGGKPEVEARFGLPQLQVSLSHTRGLVIVAVAEGHAVGIDAEWLGRKRSFDGLLNSFCTPIEKRQIAARPKACRMQTALTLWTLKEAYGKATGRGLSYPLTLHGFNLTPPALAEASKGGGAGWLFRTLSPTPAHVAALALHHGPSRVPSISIGPTDLEGMGVKLGTTTRQM
jgi:4'-phosphopantetheinyl transferase